MSATTQDPPRRVRRALVKEKIWPKANYVPHPGQVEMHRSRHRHRVSDLGRRAGKSKYGGMEILPKALEAFTLQKYLEDMQLQRRGWIVGPNYDDAEREFRVFWDVAKMLKMPLDKPGSYYDARTGNMVASLWGGRFILECRSAAHPESLDGEGLDFVLMVEAAKLKSSVWDKFIRPAIADKQGETIWTSTPEGKNHFYQKYLWGQDPKRPDWMSWQMPSWVNTHVFPGGRSDPEIIAMEEEMTEAAFNQEIGADFTEFVGRVFPDFDADIHVKALPYNPRWPLYACCDYGWTNPFVWLLLQVDVFDNVYVIGEYRCTERDINEIAVTLQHDFMSGLSKKAKVLFPDPAEPGDSRVLGDKLGLKVNGDTGGELKYRLEMIREHLKMRPETAPVENQEPRLWIDPTCYGLIEEMEVYRYPEKKEDVTKEHPELPMDKDDHGPEALGRFFRGYFGDPTSKRRGTRVSNANMSR